MKTLIITPKPDDPEIIILTNELKKKGYNVKYFIPAKEIVKINIESFEKRFEDIYPKGGLLRGFGAEFPKKIIYRLDLLKAIEESGIRLINSKESLEIASDKFLTSLILEKHGIPTPKTIVCENVDSALDAFDELGGDVVLKPLFGSKGIGIVRLTDKSFAENVLFTLDKLNEVFYLQEFIEHYNRDIRVMTIGEQVAGAMYRVGDSWKTNIHAGAKSKPININDELEELALKAAKITKTEIAGVDIIESKDGYYVLEVNSIPGFTGLQRVSNVNIAERIIDYFLQTIK
ncbi:MAG: RimK family alpha-L-glutamate ligase [Promethearchaeota archaeon]